MDYVLSLILILTAFVYVGEAWECPAHLIMMQIAMKEFTEEEKGKMNALLGGMTEHDSQFSLIEAACFHEDMTASGMTAFDEWKSYEFPYYSGIAEKDANFTKPFMDSFFAIQKLMETILTSPVDASKMDTKLEKAFAFRYLLGAIGDIHQPMRTISRVTPNRPFGDHGGELFPVDFTQKIKNLKLLWDAGMGRLLPYDRPLKPEDITSINTLATLFIQEFPRSSLEELSITDIWLMIKNSYLYAENYAYKGIREGERPSPEYTEKGWYYCRRLLTIGGYRTADILKKFLKKVTI